MCVFCGITQAPICATAGPCATSLQSIVSMGLVIGGSLFATARLWLWRASDLFKSVIKR